MSLLNSLLKKGKSFWQKFLKLSRAKKIVAVVAVLAVLFGGYKLTLGKTSNAPQYQTTTVEKGTLITSVSSSGTVTAANSANITTQASGVVNEVYVKNGDYVTAGQNIASITLDQESSQKQAAAYASYLSATSNLNSAKSKMNSLQSALFKANQAFVTDKGANINPSDTDKADPKYIQEQADWLQAEADYNNQSGVIAAAQASLSSASLSLAQTSNIITAPISGVVSNLKLTPGLPLESQVSASQTNGTTNSQTVGSIKLEGAETQASVSLTEIDAPKVSVGEKVTMTLDAFSGKTFTGKVASIDTSGSVSSGVTTYPAVITFDSAPSNIYPNMTVSATIIVSVKDNVLLVPSSAIQTSGGVATVRVLKNGKISSVEIETGDSNDTQTEIVSGLNEGDTVITGMTSTQTGSQTTSPFGNRGFGGGTRVFTGGGGRGGGGEAGH